MMDVDVKEGSMQQQESRRRKRKRPRTAQIRQDLRKVLEAAILSPKCKILHLFAKKDGYCSANLYLVLHHLKLPQLSLFLKLNTSALKSLTKRSRVFMITGGPDASPDCLKIEFQTKLRASIMNTIAYVDNLPLICTAERLSRRASVFGRVVDVYLPPPRKIAQKHGLIRGSFKVDHAGYGFVQFTTPQAVKRFCKRYIANSHLRRHSRKTRRKRTRVLSKSQQSSQALDQEPDDVAVVYEQTSFYQLELSGLESGLESDYECTKKLKSVTFNLSNVSSTNKENDTSELDTTKAATKKKKTRRKRTKIGEAVSLKVLFRGIQVFPYKGYRRLKKEYYQLKRKVRQYYTIEAAAAANQQKDEDSDSSLL